MDQIDSKQYEVYRVTNINTVPLEVAVDLRVLKKPLVFKAGESRFLPHIYADVVARRIAERYVESTQGIAAVGIGSNIEKALKRILVPLNPIQGETQVNDAMAQLDALNAQYQTQEQEEAPNAGETTVVTNDEPLNEDINSQEASDQELHETRMANDPVYARAYELGQMSKADFSALAKEHGVKSVGVKKEVVIKQILKKEFNAPSN